MFLKVSVDVISLMSDDELTSLGVQHMGDSNPSQHLQKHETYVMGLYMVVSALFSYFVWNLHALNM